MDIIKKFAANVFIFEVVVDVFADDYCEFVIRKYLFKFFSTIIFSCSPLKKKRHYMLLQRPNEAHNDVYPAVFIGILS